MKSRRGVRIPTAPPTRLHKNKRYQRNKEKAQNWKDYLDEMDNEYEDEDDRKDSVSE